MIQKRIFCSFNALGLETAVRKHAYIPNWRDIANLSNEHPASARVVGRANGARLLNERACLNKTVRLATYTRNIGAPDRSLGFARALMAR